MKKKFEGERALEPLLFSFDPPSLTTSITGRYPMEATVTRHLVASNIKPMPLPFANEP